MEETSGSKSGPVFPLEKIKDDRLQWLAVNRADETVSVTITLDLPEPKVKLGSIGRSGRSQIRVREVSFPKKKSGEIEEKINTAKVFLTQLLQTEPNYLDMSRSFIAEVNGEQLRQIASFDLTKSIAPNRTNK